MTPRGVGGEEHTVGGFPVRDPPCQPTPPYPQKPVDQVDRSGSMWCASAASEVYRVTLRRATWK